MSKSLNDLLRVQLRAQQLDKSLPLSEHFKQLEEKMSKLNFPFSQSPEIAKLAASIERLKKMMPNVTIGEMLGKAMATNISLPNVNLALPISLLGVLSGYSSQISEEGLDPVEGEDDVNLTDVLQGLREEVAELKRSSINGMEEIKQSINEMRTEAGDMAIRLFIWGFIISIMLTLLGNDQIREKLLTEVTQIFQTHVHDEHESPIDHPTLFSGGEKT